MKPTIPLVVIVTLVATLENRAAVFILTGATMAKIRWASAQFRWSIAGMVAHLSGHLLRVDAKGIVGLSLFYVPSSSDRELPLWYSFDYGGIHVIQLSSEHNWTRGSKQHEWLKNDLANVNRNDTPWVIVTAHRMMYSTQIGLEVDMRVGAHFREEVEDLFMEHKVNLVLAGHQHSYERSCALYRSECVDDGKSAPVHIVVGSAGFGLATEGFSSKYGNWSLVHTDDYGHLRATTTAETMHLEFVLNRNGDVMDRVTLVPYH